MESSQMMERESQSFPAQIEKLPKILAWVREKIEEIPIELLEKKRIELALEEAVVNVIMHALAEEEEFTLSYRFEPDRQLEFVLSDGGPAFNPLAHFKKPDPTASLAEREIGGFGISLMNKYMDSLLYRREEDKNILTLIKNLE